MKKEKFGHIGVFIEYFSCLSFLSAGFKVFYTPHLIFISIANVFLLTLVNTEGEYF
jgi:hypothetical protein